MSRGETRLRRGAVCAVGEDGAESLGVVRVDIVADLQLIVSLPHDGGEGVQEGGVCSHSE